MFLLADVPQPEEISRVDGTLDRDIVLQLGHREPLQRVHVLDIQTLKDGADIGIKDCEILPDLDGKNQGPEEQSTPVDGMEGQVAELRDSLHVDQGDDGVLGPQVLEYCKNIE